MALTQHHPVFFGGGRIDEMKDVFNISFTVVFESLRFVLI